jgi:hypothetical protein
MSWFLSMVLNHSVSQRLKAEREMLKAKVVFLNAAPHRGTFNNQHSIGTSVSIPSSHYFDATSCGGVGSGLGNPRYFGCGSAALGLLCLLAARKGKPTEANEVNEGCFRSLFPSFPPVSNAMKCA